MGARAWNLISGLLLVFVAAALFTEEQQGYFYTFLSLSAAQYFFDLGTGYVLANIAGKAIANNHESEALNLLSKQKLAAVLRFAIVWGQYAGLALFVILGAIGFVFFSQKAYPAENVSLIWGFYALFISLTMVFQLFLRLFEGIGYVVEAAIARTIQGVCNVITLFALAYAGLGLSSIVYAAVAGLVAGAGYIIFACPDIRQSFGKDLPKGEPLDYKSDILPFQSKVAATWIGGYIIFQAQIPLLYHFAGPVAAGKFGIAVQIMQALNTTANIFLTYHIKDWTRYASRGEYRKLHRELLWVTALTTGLVIAACAGLLVFAYGLSYYNFDIVQRFPSIGLLMIYAIAACINQPFFALGFYFRALGDEPLWWVSIIAGLAIIAVPLIVGSQYDLQTAIYSFAAICIIAFGVIAPLASITHFRKVRSFEVAEPAT
jgi:O-antigen/teichoic acid export membrane protein